MDSSQVSFGIAFIAGMVSFLSPCMLPLVPIFLAQLVGQSAYQSTDQRENRPARFITFLHAVMFVLGFTLTFVVLEAMRPTGALDFHAALPLGLGSLVGGWAGVHIVRRLPANVLRGLAAGV